MLKQRCSFSFFISLTHLLLNVMAESQLEKLRALHDSVPPPLAFYPLSEQFSLRDGSGNQLDGAFSGSNVTAVTGPFGLADTAFETGVNRGDKQYMSFSSPQFNFGSSSWTMALWVNTKNQVGPIFEFADKLYEPIGPHLWVKSPGRLYANVMFRDSLKMFLMSCTTTTWQFVGLVYDNSTKTAKIFCDSNFGPVEKRDDGYPRTRDRFLLGYRFNPVGLEPADFQFACLHIYPAALSTAEMLIVKTMCSLYQQAIHCPMGPTQKCETDTCRPDLSASNGYTCSQCTSGWSGPDCQTPICNATVCLNGGSCVAPNVCSCAVGWQGAACHIPICLRSCPLGMQCITPDTCVPRTEAIKKVGDYGKKMPPSPPRYFSMVKRFWIVYGEFNYNRATIACRVQNGQLATLTSLSEDNALRRKIDWRTVPGYQEGSYWSGQLWLGAKRVAGKKNAWVWDNDVLFTFAKWIGDPNHAKEDEACVLMKEKGWTPAICDGGGFGDRRYLAGALCEAVADGPLMPADNLAFTIVMRKSYFLVKGNFTWESAGRACLAYKGSLAMLKSLADTEFVLQNIDFGIVNNRTWIGLRRPYRGSSSMSWIDKTENTNQAAFLPGQPDNPAGGSQDCVALSKNEGGTFGWSDLDCSSYIISADGQGPISALCETVDFL